VGGRFILGMGARTEDITLVKAICSDDCSLLAAVWKGQHQELGGNALVMRRFGWPTPSMLPAIRREGVG